ncbi:MAG: hypothetical protein M1835_005228 [Candelina submexicana]|nr:MAG: hypothetical protein M1835_005228 [Candelina submexicana]
MLTIHDIMGYSVPKAIEKEKKRTAREHRTNRDEGNNNQWPTFEDIDLLVAYIHNNSKIELRVPSQDSVLGFQYRLACHVRTYISFQISADVGEAAKKSQRDATAHYQTDQWLEKTPKISRQSTKSRRTRLLYTIQRKYDGVEGLVI